jgi:hypothetical protein
MYICDVQSVVLYVLITAVTVINAMPSITQTAVIMNARNITAYIK